MASKARKRRLGTLAAYVEATRQAKSLTLMDIEENSNGKISNAYVSRIENGLVTKLSPDKVVALASGLRVPPHEVFHIVFGQLGEEFKLENEGFRTSPFYPLYLSFQGASKHKQDLVEEMIVVLTNFLKQG